MTFFLHKTAVVDDGAVVGAGTKIWHFSHVCKGANIGQNVTLSQNVFVGDRVNIGDECKIQNNVSVFDGVTLEKNVFCGPSMVFTNVFTPRAFISREKRYSHTLVKRGVTIGANATILCGITIGEFAFIGAGSVVLKDVKPHALLVGNPGRQIGWVNDFGSKMPLPVKGNDDFKCTETGHLYQLRGDKLSKQTDVT